MPDIDGTQDLNQTSEVDARRSAGIELTEPPAVSPEARARFQEAVDILEQTPSGRSILDDIRAGNVNITMDSDEIRRTGTPAYDAATSTINLDPRDNTQTLAIVLQHEGTHARQHRFGLVNSPDLAAFDQVRLTHAMEAEARLSEAMMVIESGSEELKTEFLKINKDYGPALDQASDLIRQGDLDSARTVLFSQYYENPVRVGFYEMGVAENIETMTRTHRGSTRYFQDESFSDGVIKQLMELPEDYDLDGITRGSMSAGMNDVLDAQTRAWQPIRFEGPIRTKPTDEPKQPRAPDAEMVDDSMIIDDIDGNTVTSPTDTLETSAPPEQQARSAPADLQEGLNSPAGLQDVAEKPPEKVTQHDRSTGDFSIVESDSVIEEVAPEDVIDKEKPRSNMTSDPEEMARLRQEREAGFDKFEDQMDGIDRRHPYDPGDSPDPSTIREGLESPAGIRDVPEKPAETVTVNKPPPLPDDGAARMAGAVDDGVKVGGTLIDDALELRSAVVGLHTGNFVDGIPIAGTIIAAGSGALLRHIHTSQRAYSDKLVEEGAISAEAAEAYKNINAAIEGAVYADIGIGLADQSIAVGALTTASTEALAYGSFKEWAEKFAPNISQEAYEALGMSLVTGWSPNSDIFHSMADSLPEKAKGQPEWLHDLIDSKQDYDAAQRADGYALDEFSHETGEDNLIQERAKARYAMDKEFSKAMRDPEKIGALVEHISMDDKLDLARKLAEEDPDIKATHPEVAAFVEEAKSSLTGWAIGYDNDDPLIQNPDLLNTYLHDRLMEKNGHAVANKAEQEHSVRAPYAVPRPYAVPLETSEQNATNTEGTIPESHVVQRGESLSLIIQEVYNQGRDEPMTQEELRRLIEPITGYNDLEDPNLIKPGQVIEFFSREEAEMYMADNLPEVGVSQDGGRPDNRNEVVLDEVVIRGDVPSGP